MCQRALAETDPLFETETIYNDLTRHVGNRRLRGLLYMGGFAIRIHNIACKVLFERLTERGKKPKVTQIAVVNKMLRQIHAVLKSQRPYKKI